MCKFKNSLIAVALATVLASPAWSATLGFSPASATFNQGSGIDVDLVISDLSAGQQLGAFDLAVNFDSTVLGFASYTLGSQLGSLASFDSIDTGAGQVALGKVNLGQVSFLWDLSAQPASFTVASVHFNGIAAGTSALSFSDVTLGDAWGNAISTTASPGSLTVAAVPEPESYAMFLAGLGLLGMIARRRIAR